MELVISMSEGMYFILTRRMVAVNNSGQSFIAPYEVIVVLLKRMNLQKVI